MAPTSTPFSEAAPSTHRYAGGDLIAGRYLLSHPVGEGAMGAVWEARDVFLGPPVAVKLLRQDLHSTEAERAYLVERLVREASALGTIRHPAVVRVLDFGTTQWSDPYLAMELLSGESLRSLLQRSGPLVAEYALQVLLPIARGLTEMHALGVVHRDMKPDNLFLAIDGIIRPKIIDFGLAKLTRARGVRQLTGCGILGTPEYMSPEQALERPDVDHRADIWGFSVVLYEALSGRLPFTGPTFPEILCAVVQHPAPSLATEGGIDPALWHLIERGLAKDPDERWASMADFADALEAWLASRGIAVDVTGAPVTSPLEVIIEMTDAWEPTSIVSHGVHAGRRRRRRVPPSRRWAAAACTLGLVTVAPTVSMIRPRVTVLYENAILQLARESRRHTSPMPPPSARPRGAQPKDPPLDSTAQR